jgi:5'-3' exonuclease
MEDKYILLDGNNLAHIAFHRAKSIILKNKINDYVERYSGTKPKRLIQKEAKEKVKLENKDFKAISGMMFLVFFRKLHKHLKNFNGKFVMTWDNPGSGKNGWRCEVYSEYKSGRDYKTDPIYTVLFDGIDKLREVLEYYPIYQIGIDGMEADDILYLYSKLLRPNKVTIISTDSDLIQIAQEFDNVTIFHPIKDCEVEIPENYDITFYKSLMGDKSDDIKGVSGFGKKKALNAAILISEGKTPEEVFMDAVPKKIKDIKEREKIVKENVDIFKRNLKIIKISNNPSLKNYNLNILKIDDDTNHVNLKKIQKFYFDHKLVSLLEEFSSISTLFTK